MTLVVGVGSRFGGDDAAGLAVLERLRGSGLQDHVHLLETEGEPAGLIGDWAGVDDVIVVDAVRSGAAPGTVHRLDALKGPLPASLVHMSSHAFGISDTVELARALGRLPRSLEIYGIEGRDFGIGAPLAPEVEQAVERVAAELRVRLRTATGRAGSRR